MYKSPWNNTYLSDRSWRQQQKQPIQSQLNNAEKLFEIYHNFLVTLIKFLLLLVFLFTWWKDQIQQQQVTAGIMLIVLTAHISIAVSNLNFTNIISTLGMFDHYCSINRIGKSLSKVKQKNLCQVRKLTSVCCSDVILMHLSK